MILSQVKTRYSRFVGRKFQKDGTANEFPGNTFICHIPKDSPQFPYLLKLREIMQSQPWAAKYSFLPPSSFHMTIFEGVCDQARKSSRWTSQLPLDAPLEKVDELLLGKWDKITKPSSFTMKARKLSIFNGITLQLLPESDAVNLEIRKFRDLLSEEYGIRGPGHNSYHFHISFAYLIVKLSFSEKRKTSKFMKEYTKKISEELGIVKTSVPELTFFSDMTDFAPSRAEAQRNRQD